MTAGVPTYDCIPTIAEAVAAVNRGGRTTSAKGVDVDSKDASGIAAALALARAADVVVLVLGIDKTIEHEGVDRTDTALPGLQEAFAQQVFAANKRVVLVLVNGGPLAIDNLVASAAAIVEAFNPAVMGPVALADTLFGRANRWGKLPYTMYPHAYITQQNMTNYDMAAGPGRTYKYYTGTPLFAFGAGESYATIGLDCVRDPAAVLPAIAVNCTLQNAGPVEGDEVIQVYHVAGPDVRRKAAAHPVPRESLVQFERMTVPVGGPGVRFAFELSSSDLQLVNENGTLTLYPGNHSLVFRTRPDGPTVAIAVAVE